MLARCVVAVSAALGAAALLAGAVPAGRGDLDPSFGAGGKVRTDFGGSEIGVAVAVQRDRRVVVAGDEGDPGPDDFLLVRYTANGKLDPTFGAGGRVATDFGSSDDLARDVEVQIDGKIVVVGGSSPGVGGDVALARYTRDGRLDPTFGAGGKVLTQFQPGSTDGASAVLLQADGRILAGGGTRSGSTSDFAIARYLPDGTLDPTFGDGGRVITPVSSANDHLFDLALQADGRLLAAGWSFQGGGPHIALARYNRDGGLDPSLDGDGVVIASFRSAGGHLLVQPGGKLLVAGLGELTRFNADGSIDLSFGGKGRARPADVAAFTAAIQPDGKILAIGTASRGGSGFGDFGVARLTADGRLDRTYGRGGSIVTGFSPGSDDQALDGVLLPDGALVVSGMSNASPPEPGAVWGPWDFAVARYATVASCVVPNLRGKTLARARSNLSGAGCRLGAVRREYSPRVPKGRVISQRPGPRTRLPERARIHLLISRGRKR